MSKVIMLYLCSALFEPDPTTKIRRGMNELTICLLSFYAESFFQVITRDLDNYLSFICKSLKMSETPFMTI